MLFNIYPAVVIHHITKIQYLCQFLCTVSLCISLLRTGDFDNISITVQLFYPASHTFQNFHIRYGSIVFNYGLG